MTAEDSTVQCRDFHRDGFLIVRGLLDSHEASLLGRIVRCDPQMNSNVSRRDDGEGGAVELVVHNDLPAETIYGAIVRATRVAGMASQLLEGEVYHYHHKLIRKEPEEGGAWVWHQDYGYWYDNGCLYPDLVSCMIAIDDATVENGCLQMLVGSHRLGRIDHGKRGDQTGADPDRVEAIKSRLELRHCELAAGDAVFFHCNVLHRSDQNRSPHPRWAFICCYNAARNDPYHEGRHPRYTPMEVWPDERVRAVGERHLRSLLDARPEGVSQ